MDQIFQLQRQIQDLRQEVSAISQVASQLQRNEANNAAVLQRLSQTENMATQQLQAIQQICNRLSQDVNAISNVAQQVTAQMANRISSGQFGTGFGQYTTGQYGAGQQYGTFGGGISTGFYSPTQSQFGTFGSQFGGNRTDEFQRNQMISQAAANRYGLGFTQPEYASNQYISNLASQGQLGSQQTYGAGTYGLGSIGTGLSQTGYAGMSTGNFAVEPAHPVQTSQYGATGFAGAQSQYFPTYSAGQASQLGSGLFGAQSMMNTGAPNVGRYSNF